MNIVENIKAGTEYQGQDKSVKARTKKQFVRIKGGPQALRHMFMKNMPTIKFGTEYSTVIGANLSTNADPQMQTIHMMRQKKKGDAPPAEADDGLPLTIYPVNLSLDTFGCTQIHMGQQFFVDFATGTTADNIYVVNGVSHKFAPGDFKTTVKMIPMNAMGTYTSLVDNMNKAIADSDDFAQALDASLTAKTPAP